MSWEKMKKGIFVLLLVGSLLPFVSAPFALLAGILFSLILGNPWPGESARWSKILLQLSVTGMGFGLSIGQVWDTGRDAVVYTIIGISGTMLLGWLLGRYLKVNKNVSILIAFGTAICGGSAIAAMAPVIKSDNDETAVSLATVFTLNSVALLLFPYIGHLLHLGQRQFGLWSALAIHDTSSVVGAAAVYGGTALAVATTVKLTRAVWIVPVALGTAWLKKSEGRAKFPLFILGFIAAAILRSLLPQLNPVWHDIVAVSRQVLVVTLFLVGAGLSRGILQRIGVRPLIAGVSLWLLVSSLTLAGIWYGLIS